VFKLQRGFCPLIRADQRSADARDITADSGRLASPLHVMAGLVPAIHRLSLPPRARKQDVDARDKRGHDDGEADSI
jgi:hypothetical protein